MMGTGATSFFGCIGTDKFGAQLKQCAAADGVNAFYKEDPTTPTGGYIPYRHKQWIVLEGKVTDLSAMAVLPQHQLLCSQAHVQCWFTGVRGLWWLI